MEFLLSERKTPFVMGTGINVYSDRTLRFLAGLGAKRWVMPVEPSRQTLASIQAERPAGVIRNRSLIGVWRERRWLRRWLR